MKRRMIALLITAALLIPALAGCGKTNEPAKEPNGREYVDSCGRTVIVPEKIERIAVSGTLAQVYVYPLCAELMVGFCSPFTEEARKYIPEEYFDLPELGQLYDLNKVLDLEALLAADPQVVIDLGESKDNMAQELDQLSEQTGVPFIHIDATVATAGQAYRDLGRLVGMEEKAEKLAVWCEAMYADVLGIMEKVDADNARRRLIYCLGSKGLNVLAEGSFHSDTMDLVSDNAAKVEKLVPNSNGNEVDMEQMILWDPEVIVFAYDSVYDDIAGDSTWQQLEAVKNGEYYEAPYGPYGWLASPPAVQRYLGMIWLVDLLYPEYVDYDLQEKVTEFYELFYGYELSDADYAELTSNALRG